MEPGLILNFVGIIVGACIVGGATYAGLKSVAQALARANEKP